MEWSELRQKLVDWSGRLLRFTAIGSAQSDGSCTVAGRTQAGGPDAALIDSRLLSPFGLRSVPPAGLDALELRAQAGIYGSMTLPADSKQYGPADLTEGDAALYSKDNPHAVVATGADVIVNQGSASVGRVGDPTGSGKIVAVLAGSPPAVTVTLTFVPEGGGTPVPWFAFTAAAGTPGTYNLPLPGKITAGAPHFKG